MELTNEERFARMAQLDDKIESTNDKLKQLKEDRDALAHGLDFGAYEGGGYAVTVVETKRFNAGVAANLINEGKMGVHLGDDCGILGTIVHLVEDEGRFYAFTSKDIEVDITELIMEG